MNTKLLRQKVLDLAIHGKLVPQNPEHEPAVVAFENFRQKSQIKYSSKTSDDIPFTIPSNWCWVRIGEITETTDYIANGSFADTRENVKFYKEENYALLVKTQDFNNNFTDDLTYTDKQGYDFLKKSQLFGGELLLSNIGASIGKALIVPSFNKPMAVAPNSIIVRPCSIYLTQLLKAVMLSSYGQNALIEFTGGSAMPKFNKTQLRSLYIPLPPLEEQKLIVKEIERIFALIDTVEQNKADLETVIKQTKSKILDLAIHGKLVPQDAADEPASKMLEKLRAEKEEKIATGQLKRDKNDSYIYKSADGKWLEIKADGSEEEIEVPFEIPESWSWCRLGNICDYGKCKNSLPNDFSDDSWILDLEDIEKDTGKIINFISFKDRNSLSTKHIFNKGDVLYSKLRPYLNKVVIAPKDGFCTSEIIPLYFNGVLENKYAQRLLMSPYFLNTVNLLTYGVKMPRLGSDDAKKILIPLPPVEEQKRMIEKIEEVYKQIDFIMKSL